jgi:uncharacterized protein (TIGR02246 family)
MAALFTSDAEMIGYDGSLASGRAEIAASMSSIFAHHVTPQYIAIVRSVRFSAPDTAILRADTGLVPHGQSDLNPDLNARHTLVAARDGEGWAITLFQNTPAQLHGRSDLSGALTAELRVELARRMEP